MSLTATIISNLLKEHNLLKQFDNYQDELVFTGISYDSRNIKKDDLFFCKGNFKEEYLKSARKNGAMGYVAEHNFGQGTGMAAIIVTDVTKAMAVLSAAFFNFPQDDLFIIGITGTKGKTSTAYFAHSILNDKFPKQVALFSTIDRIVGPNPEDEFKSDLTTPESLNLFHDMRQAVNNGMKYLVMEVSSQAYLRNRVYGLKFDCGVFLNISPDHIGRNEHKDFNNYLFCKSQLLLNSKACILNADSNYFGNIYHTAKVSVDPQNIYVFGSDDKNEKVNYLIKDRTDNLTDNIFDIKTVQQDSAALINGKIDLSVPGDYNQQNATAAIIASILAGASFDNAKQALSNISIPGRMEHLLIPGHGIVFVDYAHNYASLKALLKFVKSQYKNGKVAVVVGSPGDKGISRRAGFGKALSEQADEAYLTTDDPGFENPEDIIKEIIKNITSKNLKVHVVLDRYEAIKEAIISNGPNDVLILAGKGEDPYQKIKGVDTKWPTDMAVAKEVKRGLLNNGETKQ